MTTKTLAFSASDSTTQLAGGIWRAEDHTDSTPPLLHVSVTGSVTGGPSGNSFTLPSPGAYRYEFNIFAGGVFTLTLTSDDGKQITCSGSPFDLADPRLGAAASSDRKSFFVIG